MTITNTQETQQRADLAFLLTTQTVGPSRYEQMASGIYTIYERWHFDAATVSVAEAIDRLSGGRCVNCRKADCAGQCYTPFPGLT
jgi:hypothetical protein